MVRISGYGQTGPYKDRAGFGSSAESFAGLRYITGEPDRPAGRAAASMGDTVAGLYGVIGALMLMLQKARGRQRRHPQVVDVALYEGVFSLLESLVPDYDAYGMVRQRTGGALPGVVPTGSYPAGDGLEVVIGGNSNSVFVRLMRAIGRDDLAEDATLARHRGPQCPRGGAQRHHLRLDGRPPLPEALDELDAAGVPAGPVYDAPSIADDEHYLARDMIQTHEVVIEDEPELIRFPGVVPKIPGHEGRVQWVGPELGQHTDEVLRSIAGLTAGRDRRTRHCRRCAKCGSRSPTSSCATACRTRTSSSPSRTRSPSPRPSSPPGEAPRGGLLRQSRRASRRWPTPSDVLAATAGATTASPHRPGPQRQGHGPGRRGRGAATSRS